LIDWRMAMYVSQVCLGVCHSSGRNPGIIAQVKRLLSDYSGGGRSLQVAGRASEKQVRA
jgi:hypothetical protein